VPLTEPIPDPGPEALAAPAPPTEPAPEPTAEAQRTSQVVNKRREGVRALYVEVPDALAAALAALARGNRRTVKAEVVLALESHLRASGMDVPPLPPPRPRGRPRGKK
jgi:hypothetical protein